MNRVEEITNNANYQIITRENFVFANGHVIDKRTVIGTTGKGHKIIEEYVIGAYNTQVLFKYIDKSAS